MCGCVGHDREKAHWKGIWPGVAECQERGWYAKFVPFVGWFECDENDPDGREDLNRWSTFVITGRDPGGNHKYGS